MAAVLLLLLWQPAVTITELKPQQNIIAFLVDDSRSMSLIGETGPRGRRRRSTRCRPARWPAWTKKFQTRLYRLDSHLTRIADLKELARRGARHAHRRQPQAAGGRNLRSADRRHRPAERRGRQLRRDRRRHDLGSAQPAHPRSHRRLRPRAHVPRRRNRRCAGGASSAGRLTSRRRGSDFISVATPDARRG